MRPLVNFKRDRRTFRQTAPRPDRDLRHGYASMAVLSGESIRSMSRLLGHEKASTTLKYAHLSEASVREAVDALAPVLSGGRT